MASLKHIHQYVRRYPKGKIPGILGNRRDGQWECAHPECSHYIPRNTSDPIGKGSICNKCMNKFLLDDENMQSDDPICSDCSNPNEMVTLDADKVKRFETQAYIAKKTGRDISEITEEEIDKMIVFMNFNKLTGR